MIFRAFSKRALFLGLIFSSLSVATFPLPHARGEEIPATVQAKALTGEAAVTAAPENTAVLITQAAPEKTADVIALAAPEKTAGAVVPAAPEIAANAVAPAAPEGAGNGTAPREAAPDEPKAAASAADAGEEEIAEIADPFSLINEAVYFFNDKLYFWALKPAATGYSYVTPEVVRIGVSNFFNNLSSPVNVVNNLLQFQFTRSGLEFFRFLFNTIVGIGGFYDASHHLLGLEKQEADFGQTLGFYGIGQGLYLVWPILGPSSIRDTIGIAGDGFMSPTTYIGFYFLNFWESSGIRAYDIVNELTFHMSVYEDMKNSAVDPYVALRNAFVQNRLKKVRDARER